ncbi:MAG: hypothetical protein ACPGWR_03130 [Ardenticatenaceae bacterium]
MNTPQVTGTKSNQFERSDPMNALQTSGTTTKTVPSPFVLTDLLQMASPQGVLLNLKSPQEIMQTFSSILTEIQNVFDFQHLRLQQGGIELNLLVMSSLPSGLFHQPQNGAPQTRVRPSDEAPSAYDAASAYQAPSAYDAASAYQAPSASKAVNETPVVNQNPEALAEACRNMIQEEINHLFGYRRFQNDRVMRKSRLHTLSVVQEAQRAWMRKRKLPSGTLSEHDQAHVLRDFLTKCVFYELSPDPGQSPPQNLLHHSLRHRNEWIEYLILQWQYIDGLSRREVTQKLKTKIDQRLVIGNGTYTRRLKSGVARLAALVWQKEMQAQKERAS